MCQCGYVLPGNCRPLQTRLGVSGIFRRQVTAYLARVRQTGLRLLGLEALDLSSGSWDKQPVGMSCNQSHQSRTFSVNLGPWLDLIPCGKWS